MAKTLDKVIEEILQLAKKPLSVREITEQIHSKKLWYRPKDNQLPPQTQISARINNYRNKFVREKGFIKLQGRGVNEQRIARLAYNTNGWVLPSGFEGKSKSRESYEFKNGYAHEEWLLDLNKTINGYHYGFLEPINKNYSKYIGQVFDIYLFTINSFTNEKFWVGKLSNVEIIDEETSEKVKSAYIQKGWYKEMERDLEMQGLDSSKIGKWPGMHLFNLRFKTENFEKYPDNTYVQNDDPSISSFHYVLLHVNETPKIEKQANGKFILGRCNPSRRFEGKKITKKIEERLVEYPFIHHQISKALEKTLKESYDEVYPEHDTGFKTSVDLVGVKGKKIHFFEIKTYSDTRTCIRQAIGQLLEYCCYPDRCLADELYIVTPHNIKDEKLITYLKSLKKNIGVPIRYLAYNLEERKITQTI
jgi:hypothetical protein